VTAALVVAICQDGRARPLPPGFPNLWNVAPTGEAWNLGYVVNGPFAVNAGRTHVDLLARETENVASAIGRHLGKALVALHDAVTESASTRELLGIGDEGGRFLDSLWCLLARNSCSGDIRRKGFVSLLHRAPGSGLTHWMRARAAIPSGLRAPFAARVPPLQGTGALRVADAHLEEEPVSRFIQGHPGLVRGIAQKAVVSGAVFELLTSWVDIESTPLSLTDIVAALLTGLHQKLDANEATLLEPLVSEDLAKHVNWSALPPVAMMASDGAFRLAKNLLIPQIATAENTTRQARELLAGEDTEDLLASFAPPSATINTLYREQSRQLLRKLRVRRELGAKQAALWIQALTDNKKKESALRYLLRDDSASAVLQELGVSDRPDWLKDRREVERLTKSWGPGERVQLISRLFPDDVARAMNLAPIILPDLTDVEEPEPTLQLSRDQARALANHLYDDWSHDRSRETRVSNWSRRWYGDRTSAQLADALRQSEPDYDSDAWMELFILSTAQMLGRTQPVQHRDFVAGLRVASKPRGVTPWSQLFGRDANETTWFQALEDWAHRRTQGANPYDHWWTLLPELFACWNWRADYREIILKLPQRSAVGPYVFAPRVDPVQQLGGIKAPALPRLRSNWLLREVVRLGVIDPTPEIAAECYPPSARLSRVLERLGMRADTRSSRGVFSFLCELVGPERACFHNCFDIALISDDFVNRIENTAPEVAAELRRHDDFEYETDSELGTAPFASQGKPVREDDR